MSAHDNGRDRRRTEAVMRATGTFWCTASSHFAAGDPIEIRGRRVCAACNAARKARVAAIKRNRTHA